MKGKKINLSTVFAGQDVAIREVNDKIWLVSFMEYDLGYFDEDSRRFEPLHNPFGAKVLPMCPEWTLKIHPPTQDVDPGDEEFRDFYRRVAELNILLMVHTGSEHGSEITTDKFSNPDRLALVEGCTVIAAHSGMGDSWIRSISFPISLICCTAIKDCTVTHRCSPRCSVGALCLGCLNRRY